MRLAYVGEGKLGDDPRPLRPGGDFMADRLLERISDVAEGSDGVGIGRGSLRPRFWLASQPDPILGLSNGPARARCVTGEAAADVVARDAQQSLAVALAEVAPLEQLERLVGELEQADQVGDGGAAAPDPFRQLLFRQAEVLDQRRAGACLLDRI